MSKLTRAESKIGQDLLQVVPFFQRYFPDGVRPTIFKVLKVDGPCCVVIHENSIQLLDQDVVTERYAQEGSCEEESLLYFLQRTNPGCLGVAGVYENKRCLCWLCEVRNPSQQTYFWAAKIPSRIRKKG